MWGYFEHAQVAITAQGGAAGSWIIQAQKVKYEITEDNVIVLRITQDMNKARRAVKVEELPPHEVDAEKEGNTHRMDHMSDDEERVSHIIPEDVSDDEERRIQSMELKNYDNGPAESSDEEEIRYRRRNAELILARMSEAEKQAVTKSICLQFPVRKRGRPVGTGKKAPSLPLTGDDDVLAADAGTTTAIKQSSSSEDDGDDDALPPASPRSVTLPASSGSSNRTVVKSISFLVPQKKRGRPVGSGRRKLAGSSSILAVSSGNTDPLGKKLQKTIIRQNKIQFGRPRVNLGTKVALNVGQKAVGVRRRRLKGALVPYDEAAADKQRPVKNRICSVPGCASFGQGRNLKQGDQFGGPGPRCYRHGGRPKSCEMKGCFTASVGPKGPNGFRCYKHGGRFRTGNATA